MGMIRSGFLVMTDVDDDRKCTLSNEKMNSVISISIQHEKMRSMTSPGKASYGTYGYSTRHIG